MMRNIAPHNCPYIIEPMILEEMDQNGYLVYDPKTLDGIMIDPGCSAMRIDARIEELNVHLHLILDTHGHADHVFSQAQLHAMTKAPVWINEDDAAYLYDASLNASALFDWPYESHEADHLFHDGDIITAGTLSFQVMQVPGHSPGSSLIIDRANKVLFSGDHIFAGSIGRTDLPGSDPAKMDPSLRLFMGLPADFAVYPGHGPATSVARELRVNPFLLDLK